MNVQRVAAIACVAVVGGAIAVGLFISGSPAEQRLLRLDEQRVNDLKQLSSAVNYRWEQQRRLPATAADLIDGRFLSSLPIDPASGQAYEYRATALQRYEVCGVFDRPARPALADDFWFHESGRKCFAFDVTERDGR